MEGGISRIALAGAGNVASHLAMGLKQHGFLISGVWSRSIDNARALADKCRARVCTDVSELCLGSDLIIIAVPDKNIEDIAKTLACFDGIIAHTAGSVGMDVLQSGANQYGVFYPLQTFSKDIAVELQHVPFFIEASSEEVMSSLKTLAAKLSDKVYEADSHQRLLLHVAAVFTGNYSNLMYAIGNEILLSSSIPQEVLHPLITETARKAVAANPQDTQTGPARRHDTSTIEKHIKALSSMPEYATLYKLLANLISNTYH